MRYPFRTFSQANNQAPPAGNSTGVFPCPTPIHSQWTTNIQRSAALTNTGSPGVGSLEPSFAELRQTYAHEQYINTLGKFKSDDPKRQTRLALANLRENRAARRDLAALHAARSHLYGERDFGSKAWYSDKPGIARRLKTQTHRRQFRMGLKTNLEFFNQLRMGDLRSALTQGDPTVFGSIPANAPGSVTQFREILALTPPIDILKLFVPHKATAIVQIMNGIESLADFNQRLGRHMASQPALEPIHAVLCDMLRSGTDFATNTRRNPLGIATQALRHVCSTPDDDATVFKARTSRKTTQSPTSTAAGSKRSPYERSTGLNATKSGQRYKNYCFNFQLNTCTYSTQECRYKHICSQCGSADHGYTDCRERPAGRKQSTT